MILVFYGSLIEKTKCRSMTFFRVVFLSLWYLEVFYKKNSFLKQDFLYLLLHFYEQPINFTAKNTVISPDFLQWNFAERHIFRIVLDDLPETMRKLCLSAKFPHQEIKWNYRIFCSVFWKLSKPYFSTCTCGKLYPSD